MRQTAGQLPRGGDAARSVRKGQESGDVPGGGVSWWMWEDRASEER